MTKKQKCYEINKKLIKMYPEANCSLRYLKDYELLISAHLSAQCTDKRVNEVTKILFKEFTSLNDFANADIKELERIILPCGFYHSKSKNIKNMSNILLNDYNGKIPDTIEELTKLPGIGRKTANLIIGEVYGKPAVVVDTHNIRLCNRLGLVNTKDPYKIELELKKLLPPEETLLFCHCLVYHGRNVCIARKPKCDICNISELCDYYKNQEKK